MSSNLVRDMVVLATIGGAGFLALTNRPAIYEMIGIHPKDFVAQDVVENTEVKEKPATTPSGAVASIRKERDGHFWATARVNSTTVKFLVDTGASVVALTPADARKAGFQPHQLTYNAPVSTAGGKVMAARVELKNVSIGRVSVRKVPAIVISEGLEHSLLGMSFLGKLQKVEASRDNLLLRQ